MKFTSILSTAVVALSLGVEYISAQTPVTTGTYQFVSMVTDVNGNRFALTDQGISNASVVITPLTLGQLNQTWSVQSTPITGGFIIASNSSSLFISPANGVPGILVSSATSFVWLSNSNNVFGFTFIDSINGTTNWALRSLPRSFNSLNAVNSSSATCNGGPNPLNLWVPIRIS